MTKTLHFGFPPNEHVCNCGRHYGYGNLTAEQRAERCRGMRDRLPHLMTPHMRAYLADWERHHNVPSMAYMPPAQAYRNPYAD